MTNFNTLEELRTKEELVNYFEERGQSITEEEIEALKKSYEEAEEANGALTMQQLDDVSGGGTITRIIIRYKGHDFSHAMYKNSEGKSTLLQTKDCRNSVTIGNYEVAIQMERKDGEPEHAELYLDPPEGEGPIRTSGWHLVQHFDRNYHGMLAAMQEAYGTLTPKSLPSRERRGFASLSHIRSYESIPDGSLAHAIKCLNSLFLDQGLGLIRFYKDDCPYGKDFDQYMHETYVERMATVFRIYMTTHLKPGRDLDGMVNDYFVGNTDNQRDSLGHEFVSDPQKITTVYEQVVESAASHYLRPSDVAYSENFEVFIAKVRDKQRSGLIPECVVNELATGNFARKFMRLNSTATNPYENPYKKRFYELREEFLRKK